MELDSPIMYLPSAHK